MSLKLGGLVILILLRSVLQSKHDLIFQKTCMNILVQMSAQISLLDLYPSERIVGALEFLLKRHSRLMTTSECLEASNVEDLVKNLLVIITNILSTQTKNNPNLIYSLLYKKDVLTSYINQNEDFICCFKTVNNLLGFVSAKIETLVLDPYSMADTTKMMNIIQGAITKYNVDATVLVDQTVCNSLELVEETVNQEKENIEKVNKNTEKATTESSDMNEKEQSKIEAPSINEISLSINEEQSSEQNKGSLQNEEVCVNLQESNLGTTCTSKGETSTENVNEKSNLSQNLQEQTADDSAQINDATTEKGESLENLVTLPNEIDEVAEAMVTNNMNVNDTDTEEINTL